MTEAASSLAGLFDLTGRVACVTGASSGLGRRAADVLLAAGASVVGVARRADALADWQATAGLRAASVVADVADHAALDQTMSDIRAPFGSPDILIHAAGLN
ncbi:MAG: SDR family oxidoreductase, partial [Paracoccaceae bacterium]